MADKDAIIRDIVRAIDPSLAEHRVAFAGDVLVDRRPVFGRFEDGCARYKPGRYCTVTISPIILDMCEQEDPA